MEVVKEEEERRNGAKKRQQDNSYDSDTNKRRKESDDGKNNQESSKENQTLNPSIADRDMQKKSSLPRMVRVSTDDVENEDKEDGGDDLEEWIPARVRKQMKIKQLYRKKEGKKGNDEEKDEESKRPAKSLVDVRVEQLQNPSAHASTIPAEVVAKTEAELLEAVMENKPLLSVSELAKGVVYLNPLKTGWTAPRYIQNTTEGNLAPLCSKSKAGNSMKVRRGKTSN